MNKDAPLCFDNLARDLSPTLRRYLQRYVGDPGLADDLLQETLIRMDRGLPGFSGQSSVKTWAFAIATRVAADHYRHPDRRHAIVDIEEAAEVPDPERTIDEQVEVAEMNACIRRVIDSLPDDYRAALVLHDFEGLTGQQVAEACSTSLATAKIRLHRARQRLKSALETQCDFYRDRDDVFRCDQKPA